MKIFHILISLALTPWSIGVLAQDLQEQPVTTIRVAAFNSAVADKEKADIVCSGNHDEVVLQECMEKIGHYGKLILAGGQYIIDALSVDENGSGYLLRTPYKSDFRIESDLPAWGKGATIVISEACYKSLDDETTYSLIGGTNGTFFQVMSQNIEVEGISISLPGNQKKIICIDGYYTGRMSANRCNCSGPKNNRETDITLGVMDCIGIRGLQGSNNGTATEFNHCTVIGLGVGFALSGEHLVLISSTSIGCTYGFTFNQFPNNIPGTAQVHPITLIGCHDEVSANYPKFFDNPLGQSIRFINYAVEHYPKNLALGGDYAIETIPGQWHGIIDYAIQDFNKGSGFIKNSASIPFWAPGSGIAVESHNNTHKKMATSEERRSYAPNFGQSLFDSDLGKLLICIDPENRTWVDSNGKMVK